MAHVGVVFGGRSTEHQVSIRSARTVVQGLRQAGHAVTPLGIAADGCWVDARGLGGGDRGATKEIPPLEVPVAPDGAASAGVGSRGGLPDRPWHLGGGRHVPGALRDARPPLCGVRRHRQRPRHGQGARQAPARRGRGAGGGLRGGLAARLRGRSVGVPRPLRAAAAAALRQAEQRRLQRRRAQGRRPRGPGGGDPLRPPLRRRRCWSSAGSRGGSSNAPSSATARSRPRWSARSSPATSSTTTRTSTCRTPRG